MIKRKRALVIAMTAALGVTAAACGDDDEESGDTAATTAETTGATTAEPEATTAETTGGTDGGDDPCAAIRDSAGEGFARPQTTPTTEAGSDTTGGSDTTTGDTADTTEGGSDSTTPDSGTSGSGGSGGGGDDVSVAVLFDITGRGDKSFNDAAAAGLDAAVEEFGVEGTESTPSAEGDRAERLNAAVDDGNDLVIAVGFLWTDTVTAAAEANPDTNFAIVDSVVEADNTASLLFAEEQGSFLVGAAAALTSETDTIGFIGGASIDLIKKFEAGYRAGAECVNPDIEILAEYISEDPSVGFNDSVRGKELGAAMYEADADVVYAAAGASGTGVLEATSEAGEPGEVWNIGVDSDLYEQVEPDLQEYVLTSMLKRVDVAVKTTIGQQVDGSFAGGITPFDLAVDGVGYSTSGGFVDDIAPTLEELKELIIDGTIVVPSTVDE